MVIIKIKSFHSNNLQKKQNEDVIKKMIITITSSKPTFTSDPRYWATQGRLA